jgi:hypothetical protein
MSTPANPTVTAETNIKCPYCTEVIAAAAKKCRRKSCGALRKKRWLVSDRRGLIRHR